MRFCLVLRLPSASQLYYYKSTLSAPSQINPVEMLDSAASVTRLGEGVSDSRAVPASVRLVHSNWVMDPYRTQVRADRYFYAPIDGRYEGR